MYLMDRDDANSRNHSRFSDLGELDHPTGFPHDDAVDLSRNSIYNMKHDDVSIVSNINLGGLNSSIEIGVGEGVEVDARPLMFQKDAGVVTVASSAPLGNGNFENWAESVIADSQQTDTSTDVENDDKTQFRGAHHGTIVVVDSMDHSKRTGDQKTLRRLAQNREAARKSRLRKKAYVQQLENSRLKLTQLEQELQRARQQGVFVATGYSGDQIHPLGGNEGQFKLLLSSLIHGGPSHFYEAIVRKLPRAFVLCACLQLTEFHCSLISLLMTMFSGALAFDMDYARWLDEHQRLINELRCAVNSNMADNDLRLLVDGVMTHYDEVFRLKSLGAKSDAFHMLSGMWKTPAERCFMWLGGFRSSELLKILGNNLEPLTDHQLMGICNLQQSSQQAEDALSQGMEALQQSLAETLSSTPLGPAGGSGNVADYMGQMATSMGKLATLENFLHQADLLRQQTLQQMHRILTTRQAARALIVINDYLSRLRALSSLWLARPRD
ncbi:Transcription factor TGA like domain [Dillenia turbinata]|uniref:Transcription factor TGA like domain n=1 Tax=Dillenia turbinata TaxID=194707 RepID=A0AAN8Z271_9MAGN